MNKELPNELWTTQTLKEAAFSMNHPDLLDNQPILVGVLEQPLLDMFPVTHVVPSLLHRLLGIGNKIMSSFFNYCYDRFETLTTLEIKGETKLILAEINHNNKTEQHELLKLESTEARDERILFNRLNAGRLLREKKIEKDTLLKRVEEARIARDEFDSMMKSSAKKFRDAKSEEESMKKEQRYSKCTIKTHAENHILVHFMIYASSYYGGEYEGNSCSEKYLIVNTMRKVMEFRSARLKKESVHLCEIFEIDLISTLNETMHVIKNFI